MNGEHPNTREAPSTETHLYRKKPVVIKAMQNPATPIDAPEREPLLDWLDDECEGYVQHGDGAITVETLEGAMRAAPGDWIIKGVKGEFYPCKPDIFEATYERA